MDLTSIKWLLNTHSHGDHIGGHARLTNLANLKVAAHKSSAPKVADPVPYAIETRTKFPEHSPAPQCYLQGVQVDRVLEDGEIIAGRLQVIHTPGHDDDCVCWYDLQTKTLITGDSLQGNGTPAQGVGFYKNLTEYLASVRKLQQLPIDNIICGHDYDEIGWNISGAEAVSKALQCCEDAVARYHNFILQQHRAGMSDSVELALALIRKHGCAMPEKLFLALYTVTQHLEKINSTNQ
jgi:glyoxylase-like metal-dependent hydrolase (beta-lactamase superfamily II)